MRDEEEGRKIRTTEIPLRGERERERKRDFSSQLLSSQTPRRQSADMQSEKKKQIKNQHIQ